jgi:hypothetical protein
MPFVDGHSSGGIVRRLLGHAEGTAALVHDDAIRPAAPEDGVSLTIQVANILAPSIGTPKGLALANRGLFVFVHECGASACNDGRVRVDRNSDRITIDGCRRGIKTIVA